jgi:hypothetical protein
MTRLLTLGVEGQFPRVLLHKVFEALKCNDFPERDVNSFCSRFDSQYLGCLVGKVGIESDGGHSDGHYRVSPSYIHYVAYVYTGQPGKPCPKIATPERRA